MFATVLYSLKKACNAKWFEKKISIRQSIYYCSDINVRTQQSISSYSNTSNIHQRNHEITNTLFIEHIRSTPTSWTSHSVHITLREQTPQHPVLCSKRMQPDSPERGAASDSTYGVSPPSKAEIDALEKADKNKGICIDTSHTDTNMCHADTPGRDGWGVFVSVRVVAI